MRDHPNRGDTEGALPQSMETTDRPSKSRSSAMRFPWNGKQAEYEDQYRKGDENSRRAEANNNEPEDGQQPFGGARASGTNDKAGSVFNLIRWVSPRTIKENFNPPMDYTYPFMGEE